MTIRDQVAINPAGSPIEQFMVQIVGEDERSVPINLPEASGYHALSFITPAGQRACLVAVSEDSEAELMDPVNFWSNFESTPVLRDSPRWPEE
jgi:hypothetical protein